ncbi:MAG: prepilin-type N-terminal cleavage/methylation domain-containing protein [Candidatus Wildermuthbacteria bacterium]|nr:prepilin-type N-terminal cleavage/methylation domain-containing protein [Candidatus Wildermuthbacteria bacterium]
MRAKGFTLVELLVAMGIIVLTTGVVLPSWRASQQTLRLEAQAHLMAQTIRSVIEYSLQGKHIACPGSTSLKGYGVYASSNERASYVSFAECNGDWLYSPGQDAVITTYALGEGVNIQAVSPTPAGSVVFVPPSPTVRIGPGSPSVFRIILALPNNPQTKEITVNIKGVVEVR